MAGRVSDHYRRACVPEPKIEALLTHCSARYLNLLHNLEPRNVVAAEKSIILKPDAPTLWFWVAEIRGGCQNYSSHKVTQENWEEIAALLKTGLALALYDGLRWRLLAMVTPGFNGCYRAGALAEKLGDCENAIPYYRYSRYEGALRRADELERKILVKNDE